MSDTITDWMKEEIVVRHQVRYKILLQRVKITKVTEKSVYAEFRDEVIRLSKKRLESNRGHQFMGRWIRFFLLRRMPQHVQDRMKGEQVITDG